MTFMKMKTCFVALSLALGLVACGSGKSTNRFQGFDKFNTGFRVINADPYPQTENVLLTSPISIIFSEAVDFNSVKGNIQIIESIVSQKNKDIVAEGGFSQGSTYVANDTITFTLGRNLVPAAIYQITVSQAVRSSTGANLVGQTFYRFSTGTLDSIGSQVSIPGAPFIVNGTKGWQIMQGSDLGNCYSVSVEFNEDLVDAPLASFVVKADLILPVSNNVMYGYQAFPGNQRVWYLEFPVNMCDPLVTALGSSITVTITEAIDLAGERASGMSRKFNALVDYF